jgi:hypothetical protein
MPTFDPRRIEAQLALGRILPEEMPPLAWDALEAGYDGPAIRRMGALDHPSGWEVDQVLPRFRKEIGLRDLSKTEASIRVAFDIATHLLESRKDPLPNLKTFARLCYEADYPDELMPLYSLDDELYLDASIYGRTLDAVRQDARDAMITLIRTYKEQEKLP